MSKKKIIGYIKLQLLAGKATPAPPTGPALGQKGLNIMEFCKAFNAQTADMPSDARIPVVITAYAGKTFSFILKKPTASYFLQKAAGVNKGSSSPGKGSFVGSVTQSQLEEIAREKMQDMNAYDVEHAVCMLKGTAQSMGIEVKT
jgi:large subunit ribosomal protein L11